MVLTNFELWAADGSSATSLPLDFESSTHHTRHLNPFDPRVMPQLNSNLNHLSSNGYYGFSYINAAQQNGFDLELNNNNIINNNNNVDQPNNNNNNNNNIISNNNAAPYNLTSNDANGMSTTIPPPVTKNTNVSAINIGSSAHAAGDSVNVVRCKKRFFVSSDDNDDAFLTDYSVANNKSCYNNNYEVSAKRCRFDDDFSAQYCNDFFQLPSTQIATQSCLMDTEETPQQQVDVAMLESNNNIEKYEPNPNLQLQNVETLATENHSQHSPEQQTQQEQQQQSQQQHLYHQQHYQDTFSTIKCHFNNNVYDTFSLNNHSTQKIDLKCTENLLKVLSSNSNNHKRTHIDINNKYDNDVASENALKIDDATLFAQLHGGSLHHHYHYQHLKNTVALSRKDIQKDDDNIKNNYYYEEEF